MNARAFCDLVKSIKYKKGWRFETDIDWMRGANVIVRLGLLAAVPDAGNPDVYISVTQSELFTMDTIREWTREHAIEVVREFIMAFERHEFGEWFRVGDEKPFDPHRPTTVPGEEYGRD